jgi:hypothetical protein
VERDVVKEDGGGGGGGDPKPMRLATLESVAHSYPNGECDADGNRDGSITKDEGGM